MIKILLRKILTALTVWASVFSVFSACAQAGSENSTQPIVGGPCAYKSYPGRATILSISEIKPVDQTDVPRFEVKFSFVSRQPVPEEFARPQGRKFVLYGNHFRYPDRSFLTRHDIRIGKELDSTMQVIVSGTCTPVMFDFPALH